MSRGEAYLPRCCQELWHIGRVCLDHGALHSTEYDAATGEHRLKVGELAFQLRFRVAVFVSEELAKVSDRSGFDIRTIVEIV